MAVVESKVVLSCGNGGCELSFSEEEHCWMCLLEQTSVHCGDMPHNTSRNDLCCCWSHMKQITLFARERCQAVFTVFSKRSIALLQPHPNDSKTLL